MLESVDLVRGDYLSLAWSLMVVYGFGVLLAGIPAAALFTRFVRLRMAARQRWPSAHRPGDSLVPGTATLRGTVAPTLDGAHTEHLAGDACDAREFDLVLEDGARVRCAAKGWLYAADGIDASGGMESGALAALRTVPAGAEVVVAGELRRVAGAPSESTGYRDAAETWVLVPGAGGRMLIATKKLPARESYAASRVALRWALGLTLGLGVLHVGVLGEFHALMFQGEVVFANPLGSMTRSAFGVARVTSTAQVPRTEPGDTVCTLYAEYLTEERGMYLVEDEVDCGALQMQGDGPVPFLVAPSARGIYQLGAEPRLTAWRANAVFLFLAAAAGAYLRGRSRPRGVFVRVCTA